MNEKEIAEIRHRYKPEKHNISRIRGCYVDAKKDIISEFSQSLELMTQDETESILSLFRKTLGGTAGKNLVDIEFPNEIVLEGEEHKTLMTLRDSELKDDGEIENLYRRIISSVKCEDDYIILLASDRYDVFEYSRNEERQDESTSMFSYILCAICPVKITKPELSYYSGENSFHNIAANSVIASPILGFMFPNFDDRTANIYNVTMYTKDTAEDRENFTDTVFGSKPPMPATVQKETFGSIIEETVSDECDIDTVQIIQDKINEMIEIHKADKNADPLTVSKRTVKRILDECNIDEEKIASFESEFDERFGKGAEILPQNLIDPKKFEITTPDVTIKVNPERRDLVSTQIIDGVKYILIRTENDDVKLNGVNIHIK